MEARDARAWRLEEDVVLVESYRPGRDHAAFLDVFSARADAPDLVGRLADGEDGVRFVCAIVVPDDEIVFYVIASRSAEQVRRLIEAAGLAPTRISAASWAAPLSDHER